MLAGGGAEEGLVRGAGGAEGKEGMDSELTVMSGWTM